MLSVSTKYRSFTDWELVHYTDSTYNRSDIEYELCFRLYKLLNQFEQQKLSEAFENAESRNQIGTF